jgi:hypothetical protein
MNTSLSFSSCLSLRHRHQLNIDSSPKPSRNLNKEYIHIKEHPKTKTSCSKYIEGNFSCQFCNNPSWRRVALASPMYFQRNYRFDVTVNSMTKYVENAPPPKIWRTFRSKRIISLSKWDFKESMIRIKLSRITITMLPKHSMIS